jgi:enamine deaminase RidA (YjgF/YER057c/UK114 family)
MPPAAVAAPLSEYANVALIDAPRRLVTVSGQVALRADGTLCADASIEGQTRQTYANIGTCLEAAGLGWGDVLKFTTFVTTRDHVQGFYAVRKELFAELYPSGNYPGNSLLVVSGLVRPEFLIEIEAIAATA